MGRERETGGRGEGGERGRTVPGSLRVYSRVCDGGSEDLWFRPRCVRCPCARERSHDECRLLSLTELNSTVVSNEEKGSEGGERIRGIRGGASPDASVRRGENASVAKLTVLRS